MQPGGDLAPALLTLAFDALFRRLGWVHDGDLSLSRT